MFSITSARILALMLLQGSPVMGASSVTSCEDLRRVELSLSPEAMREVCVSPGLMTGFRFDAPVVVELQDEVRFEEVVRGRQLLTLLPPSDMVSGERLRLLVHFGEGEAGRTVVFTLVAHRGQATHQVEVFRDQRSRESFQQEVEQERVKNHQLRVENQQLRARIERVQGLSGLIADGALGFLGLQTLRLDRTALDSSEKILFFRAGYSYRTDKTVAAEFWMENLSSEPWMVAGGVLVNADGEEMTGLKFRQDEIVQPHGNGSVIVEANAGRSEARGQLKLKFWDANLRVVTLPRMVFP